MTRAQRAALGPMHEGRVDVIGGGAIIVEELAYALGERAGIDELVVSEHDILDGIAAVDRLARQREAVSKRDITCDVNFGTKALS